MGWLWYFFQAKKYLGAHRIMISGAWLLQLSIFSISHSYWPGYLHVKLCMLISRFVNITSKLLVVSEDFESHIISFHSFEGCDFLDKQIHIYVLIILSFFFCSGILHEDLRLFLETNVPKPSKKAKCLVGVSDSKIGAAIQEEMGISCSHIGVMPEIIRGKGAAGYSAA